MTQAEFEKALQPGDEVRVRWRKGSGRGIILKVNRISFTVRLDGLIGEYPAKSEVRINRVTSGRWSATNCVRPIEG